jgi:hypothetical protein
MIMYKLKRKRSSGSQTKRRYEMIIDHMVYTWKDENDDDDDDHDDDDDNSILVYLRANSTAQGPITK